MQFSVASLVAALAATASATYVPSYNNVTSVVPYPTGTSVVPYPTGTAAPTGSVPTPSSSFVPFPGAASKQGVAGSAFAMVIAGGVALMI
jgi:hypothetical protein